MLWVQRRLSIQFVQFWVPCVYRLCRLILVTAGTLNYPAYPTPLPTVSQNAPHPFRPQLINPAHQPSPSTQHINTAIQQRKKMSFSITVLYPGDAKFNMQYYLSSHMPLVKRLWTPHGLKSYRVLSLVATPSGDKPPYGVQCALEFTTREEFEGALKACAPEVLGDVPNFSDRDPILMIGEQVGTS